jgi:hypothetical protein
MPSLVNTVFCAIAAAAFWIVLGYAISRHIFPRGLATGAAPVLGWAVHSAATLPIFMLAGFSPAAIAGIAALCAIAAGVSLRLPAAEHGDAEMPAIPAYAIAAAALLALVPAAAIFPKFTAQGVQLADPIFDHSKIAIIDAMTRLGLPPVNPVFGEIVAGSGAPRGLAYYYLWHYSAAELASVLRATGWEADIGLTWFTAFASLMLMMGLAVRLGKRTGAAIWVVVLAAAGSLWLTLGWLFGSDNLEPFLLRPTGTAGWLFQAAWVPQHLMSASCVVIAMLLVVECARRQSPIPIAALALTIAAGFESSTYVGGVTFAIAALAVVPFLLAGIDPERRLRLAAGLAIAALIAVCFVAPFLRDQFVMVAARGDRAPIVLHHAAVFGEMLPPLLRRALDLPAFWLILLPIEFPAIYLAGTMALYVMLRNAEPGLEKTAIVVLATLTATGLVVAWLLASTLGDINDLGLRAVLPAILVLIAATAAGLMLLPRRGAIVAAALGGIVLGLPNTARSAHTDFFGRPAPAPDASMFAQTPPLWDAVRRFAPANARVANNPLFLAHLTPWPVNVSWALLANRSSCFAGRELALAFAPLPPARREDINAQFIRIFGGQGTPQDLSDMATKYGCDVVVVVPQDKAWSNDPFAASPFYRLAENENGRWRIYVVARPSP